MIRSTVRSTGQHRSSLIRQSQRGPMRREFRTNTNHFYALCFIRTGDNEQIDPSNPTEPNKHRTTLSGRTSGIPPHVDSARPSAGISTTTLVQAEKNKHPKYDTDAQTNKNITNRQKIRKDILTSNGRKQMSNSASRIWISILQIAPRIVSRRPGEKMQSRFTESSSCVHVRIQMDDGD